MTASEKLIEEIARKHFKTEAGQDVCVNAILDYESRREAEQYDLPARIIAMCKHRGWSMHWTHRGAYLHLESSELIEAIRGKQGDPLKEAADVLIVLMSITQHAGIAWRDVIAQADSECIDLMVKPHYAGEEYDSPLAKQPAKNAATQRPTDTVITAPSQEGVGQGDAAVAAPDADLRKLAEELASKW